MTSSAPLEPVLATPHFLLDQVRGAAIIVLRRTNVAVGDTSELDETFAHLMPALERLSRVNHRLLVDVRLGPGRNDPEFERAFQAHRLRAISLFARVAVLVRSAAGMLQVQRYVREESEPAHAVRVFQEPSEALEWLER